MLEEHTHIISMQDVLPIQIIHDFARAELKMVLTLENGVLSMHVQSSFILHASLRITVSQQRRQWNQIKKS